MSRVAKLLIISPSDEYLLLIRNSHPFFGQDPDLPGGTLEDGEQPLGAMVREVYEEAGITIDSKKVKEIYSGTEYSHHRTHYTLFITRLDTKPSVELSWEHSSYEWLDRDAFLEKAKNANDTYMHMVYDTLTKKRPASHQ